MTFPRAVVDVEGGTTIEVATGCSAHLLTTHARTHALTHSPHAQNEMQAGVTVNNVAHLAHLQSEGGLGEGRHHRLVLELAEVSAASATRRQTAGQQTQTTVEVVLSVQ